MARRNNILILLGAACFVLGAAIVFLLVDDDGDGNGVAGRPGRGEAATQVLIARERIPAGTLGSDAVAEGLVTQREVEPGELAPGAIQSTATLGNQTFAVDVEKGRQLTTATLRPAQVRGQSIAIPEGKQAVAVQLDFVPGVAGYVGVGDRINIYGVIAEGRSTQLLMTGVEVLDVSVEVAPRRAAQDQEQARTTGNAITYLLALDEAQTQAVIANTSFERLYMALTQGAA